MGDRDISDKFAIPQKLYGREAEIETLLTAFDRVSGLGGVELMLVAGYSGIGKSALVKEVHKPITEKRGYFISGKFDQFQRNIPYSAVVAAFSNLMGQLLTETADSLQQWQAKLLAAVGVNGQVIIDVIPEVELIIGPQPDLPELGPTESQNRFNLVFQNFIRAFCAQSHPLVIFLDDLQWADSATLKLIELVMTDSKTEYLFLIGAYRDNEVSPIHPLMLMVSKLREVDAIVKQITLDPLAREHICQLLAETLSSDSTAVAPLAELVVRKTLGNPFFVNEFLKTLYAEQAIAFDLVDCNWQWDVRQIEAMEITDNVVDLLIGKLKKQPARTQEVLRLAACVGAAFDLRTLSIISEKTPEVIFPDLKRAMQSGLILPASELDAQLLIHNYRFLHDRVQQAAYALNDAANQKAVHLQIGRLLLENLDDQQGQERFFEIVDHLNLGLELVTDPEERERIAQLNLIAGQKAKAATAYGAAVKYLMWGEDF